MSDNVAGDEPYLLVEEVAERLGLPLSVLLHRVEAGDIPSRRVETEDGVHYALRLGDLGIELDDEGMRASAIETDESTLHAKLETPTPAPQTGGIVFEPEDAGAVESAIVSAFNSGPHQLPSDLHGPSESGHPAVPADQDEPWKPPSSVEPDVPRWSTRPREPRQPPPWIIQDPAAAPDTTMEPGEEDDAASSNQVEMELPGADAEETIAAEVAAAGPEDEVAAAGPEAEPVTTPDEVDDDDRYLPPALAADEDDGIPALVHAADAIEADDYDEATTVAELAVPPPSRRPLGLLDTGSPTPRGDLASMSLDARELVAGLLDRWERTLEQRIYTEQRQRFQAELVTRQNMVKELQMELHTARAEHAAAQAEKDRLLAAKERELADRERDLAESRRRAEDAQQLIATAGSRKRGWFRRRDD